MVARRGFPHDAAHGRTIVVLEPAAEGVRQQLLGHRFDELPALRHGGTCEVRPGPETAFRRAARPSCPRAFRPRRRASRPPRRSSPARSPADPSERDRWKQAGLSRCRSSRSRTDAGRPSSPRSGRPGTSAGGEGGGVPSRLSRTQRPRSTGDVRFGYDVTVRKLPCPSNPPRGSSSPKVTRRKWLPYNVQDAVVPRQSLVQDRVVRPQKVRPRSGPRGTCSRRTTSSPARTPRAGSRRSRERRSGRAPRSADCAT